MNKDEAFINGANAYYNGIKRSPLLDPKFNLFTTPNSNITADNLKHWLRGWDAANLEYQEYVILQHEMAAKAEEYNERVLTFGSWRPDPEAEHEEARERWLEDLEYKSNIRSETGPDGP